jgi:hypothetical protein
MEQLCCDGSRSPSPMALNNKGFQQDRISRFQNCRVSHVILQNKLETMAEGEFTGEHIFNREHQAKVDSCLYVFLFFVITIIILLRFQ